MVKSLLKKYWPFLALTLLISAITSLMGSISPYFYGKIIDEVLPGKDVRKLLLYVGIIIDRLFFFDFNLLHSHFVFLETADKIYLSFFFINAST